MNSVLNGSELIHYPLCHYRAVENHSFHKHWMAFQLHNERTLAKAVYALNYLTP